MADIDSPGQDVRTPLSQQPKQMSSRLLNMKFMQRATAASPTTSTPASSARTPGTEPFAKRRRIDSATTSSPAISVPGTPKRETPNGQATPNTGRGGISTFSRFEGADTDWVLNVNVAVPNTKTSRLLHKNNINQRVNGHNESTPRPGASDYGHQQDEDNSVEDDDIWTLAQPSGRQTFGSFTKRKTRVFRPEDGENDEDLSSVSDSDSDDSDDNSNSDLPSDAYPSATRGHKTPTPHRSQAQPRSADKNADSDEEMRQVRQAMEQKHRNTMFGPGQWTGRGGRDTSALGGRNRGRGDQGKKRKDGRDEGNYKIRKARKTI